MAYGIVTTDRRWPTSIPAKIWKWITRLLIMVGVIHAVSSGAMAADRHIVPTLVAESLTPAPGRQTTLAITMRVAPQWHGYWKMPGGAGTETRARWSGPAGMTFGPLQFPVPKALRIAGVINHIYDTDFTHLVAVTLPAGLTPGTRLPVSVKLHWLACNPAICVPENADLSIVLTVGDGAPDPAHVPDFDTWRAALPHPLGAPAHFGISKGRFRLELPLRGASLITDPHVFPLTDTVIDYSAPQRVTATDDRLVIETAAKANSAPASFDGVLSIGDGQGIAFTATSGTGASKGKGADAATAQDTPLQGSIFSTLFLALGGAIIGGLLLNIMPCVFPVLSIKALSLARSGGSEQTARREALSYSAGVILVCAGLGILLLILRNAGQVTGWAFQLQDVRVIILLLLLVSAMAFNLAGLFELPMITGGSGLAGQGGVAGAFWTGAFAAFIATPCSGPFMGTALGVALLLPPWASIVIFAGLGFGLALPFLLLGFVPSLRNRLPRPGPWMDGLRRLLSLPIFLTALGLAWIAGRQAGIDGMTMAVGAAMLLGLALWQVGRGQARLSRHVWWPLAPSLAIAGAILVSVPRQTADAAMTSVAADGHERFDEQRLATLRAEGRPVLLYFTADWCLTCKVNEKAAIERREVQHAFAAKKIAVMVGDWTRGDPAISRFLGEHSRSGVPFYLFYPADGGEPKELPQLLTPDMLTDLG